MCCFFLLSLSCFSISYLNLPKSNILHTGGSAFGEISIKSKSDSLAKLIPSSISTIPREFPSASINLIFFDLIFSLTLYLSVFLIFFSLGITSLLI